MFKKLIEALFGKKKQKTVKELLKDHPHHISCDYGITEFNETKRDQDRVDSENASISKRRNGGGGQPPPPLPPPSLSSAILYCDFNGGVVSGTQWNVSGDIVYAPSGFNLDEQDNIMGIIANFYSKWNLTVTKDKAVYDSANTTRRTRIIFTASWEWYGKAGGVAFIGSMKWGDNTPCWVFSSLLNYVIMNCAEAGTHEAGHTIGLRHQSVYDSACVKTAEYNPGKIMGSPYSGNPPIWFIGPDSLGCQYIQDDQQVITAYIGLKTA